VDGRREQRRYEVPDGERRAPAWSPDGRRIAVTCDGNPGDEICVVDATTGTVSKPTCPLGVCNNRFRDPTWSPDGARIAMGGDFGVSVMNADGSGLRTFGVGRFFSHPAWSPDGTRIAYVRDRDASGSESPELRIVDVDGTNDNALPINRCPDAAAWSPDGTAILAGETDFLSCVETGIWSASATGGRGTLLHPKPTLVIRRLTTGAALRRIAVPLRDTTNAWLAFSGRYVFVSDRNNSPADVYRYTVATGNAVGRSTLSPAVGVISASDFGAVYAVRRRIALLNPRTGRSSTVAVAARVPTSLAIVGKHIFWAEPWHGGSRVRELTLP